VDTWPLRKMEEKKLMVFERKAQKKIIGQVQYEETGKWNARKYNQLEGLDFKKRNILDIIRSRQRLKWVGTHGKV